MPPRVLENYFKHMLLIWFFNPAWAHDGRSTRKASRNPSHSFKRDILFMSFYLRGLRTFFLIVLRYPKASAPLGIKTAEHRLHFTFIEHRTLFKLSITLAQKWFIWYEGFTMVLKWNWDNSLWCYTWWVMATFQLGSLYCAWIKRQRPNKRQLQYLQLPWHFNFQRTTQRRTSEDRLHLH